MIDRVTALADAWALPATILVVGFVLGLIVERIVLVRFRHILSKSRHIASQTIVDAVKGSSAELITTAAAYVAVGRSELSASAADAVRDLLFVLIVLIVTILLSRLSGAALRAYMQRTTGAFPATSIFVNVIRGIVFIVGTLIVLQHFGISITPILTALGVGGLAVALALQDTLSGLFSGLQILAARQIKPGDYIRLDSGEEGEVIDITWRNTIIRQISNNEIIIPNSKMASVIVTNFQLPQTETSVLVQCGVHYDSDLERVEVVVKDVAASTLREIEGGVGEYEPLVRFHTFGDSSIDFTIVLRAQEFRDQYLLKHEFIKRLKRRFDQEGIEIPFPIRTVHITQEGEG